jgi:cob(I)alamin adenosyltransferase
MKIYTRTGDDGTTMLFGGPRVPKYHLRVEAYGTVDELNSALGLVRALGPQPDTDGWLHDIQQHLFYIGSDLATPMDAKTTHIVRLDRDAVVWLERAIDTLTDQLPPLKTFILPGGAPTAAQVHVARTICRRAERVTAYLAESETIGQYVLMYLNRLSDFLFTLARWENFKAGIEDEQWSVR